MILQIALIAVAALVVGTNLLHWPGIQFDEGTYMANAWALQHGRLANYTYSYGHPPLAWLLIFFWTEAGGILGHAMFSIDHGREFMLLVCLATCPLLYILARRLEFGRLAAASAVLLFALCPLGIFYHRAVLLDNPSMAFAIAAFALAWTPRRRLWAFVGSGACFALSVLCKETTLDLLPALCVAVFQNVDRRTRPYCLVLFLTSFLLTGGFYPLYAALKGELVPGRGHVSLMAYLMVQLVSRKGTGSVLDPHSQSNAIVTQWLVLDHWLLGLALASDPGRAGATNHAGHRAGVPDPGSNRLPARLPAQHVRDRDDPVRCAHRSREHRSRMALGTDAAIPGGLVGAAGGPGRPGVRPGSRGGSALDERRP